MVVSVTLFETEIHGRIDEESPGVSLLRSRRLASGAPEGSTTRR